MKWPLQITYRRVTPTAEIEEWIRDEAEKLDNFYNRVLACRVAVEIPHRHHRRGESFHICIDVRVPGGEVVVNREPSHANEIRRLGTTTATKQVELDPTHKDLRPAIKSAFRTVERRLQDYARCQRGAVKMHLPQAEGVVSILAPEDGYGFLTTNDGREIYFHHNSVLKQGFSRLREGTKVTFVEEQGEKGPQASTVRILEEPQAHQEIEAAAALVH